MWLNNDQSPMSEQSDSKSGEIWHVPQSPFSIECSAAVLDHIRQEVEAALRARRGEHEIGGVLFGHNQLGGIRIVACRPLRCEHAMGPGFVLSAGDEKQLSELIAAPAADSELHGLAALGWYHSHIHSRIFLSERDLQIHSRYFPAPFQVALVLRTGAGKPIRAGYFFWDLDGGIHADSSYREFVLKSPDPGPILTQSAPFTANPPSDKDPVSSKPTQPIILVCSNCGGKRLLRSHRSVMERIGGLAGLYPYRCEECLSRSFQRRSRGLLELAHSHAGKRPEEQRRAWLRTRRELILYGAGILGFLLFLFYYLIRDTSPKPDQL